MVRVEFIDSDQLYYDYTRIKFVTELPSQLEKQALVKLYHF